MDMAALRRRCEARLRELDLPVPLDVHAFCRTLGVRRGRPIELRAVAGRVGPSGVWVAGPSTDLIFYEQEAGPLHQQHIILHELAHLLCGHPPVPVSEAGLAQLLFPHVTPESVESVLRRGAYSAEEEREAELLASLILEKTAIGRPTSGQRVGPDDEAAALLRRLQASLEEAEEGADPA